MTNKAVVDKVIWENYYRSSYNTLCTHLFKKDKMCGIYKITDLISNMEYIGQSRDIKSRIKTHIKTSLAYGKPSNKLYQAMQAHGPQNFTFEILEEVSRDKLNEREKYWIDFFNTKEQLNSTIGGS